MPDEDFKGKELRLDDIRIILSLERLGELIAHVASHFAQIRGIDPPDFDGQEMRDMAISGWKHVCFMADREQFKASVATDLKALTAPGPEHKSEFGL